MRFFNLLILILFLPGPVWAQENSVYAKADSVALAYHPHRFTTAKKIAQTLCAPFEGEEDKARVLFRWVTENIRYDVKQFQRLKSQNFRERRRSFRNSKQEARRQKRHYHKLVQGTLYRRKAVCRGYSELYAYLCSQAGLFSEVVTGHSRSGTTGIGRIGRPLHAWNTVRIDGKLKLVDVTWGSGSLDEDRGIFYPSIRNYYFLTPPRQFAFNHYPENPDNLLFVADTFHLKDFYTLPIPQEGYFRQDVNLISPLNGRLLLAKGQEQRIRFWSKTLIRQAELVQLQKKRISRNRYSEESIPIDFQLISLSPTYYELRFCPAEKRFAPLLLTLNWQATLVYQLNVKNTLP